MEDDFQYWTSKSAAEQQALASAEYAIKDEWKLIQETESWHNSRSNGNDPVSIIFLLLSPDIQYSFKFEILKGDL